MWHAPHGETTEGFLHTSTLPVKASLIFPALQAPSCWSILALLHDLAFTPEALVLKLPRCASQSVCKCIEMWRAGAGGGTSMKAVTHLWWWHSPLGEQGPEILTGNVRQRFALAVQTWRAKRDGYQGQLSLGKQRSIVRSPTWKCPQGGKASSRP